MDIMGMMSAQQSRNNKTDESSPLLPSNASDENAVGVTGGNKTNQQQQQYYFLGKASGTTESVRDMDGGEVVEGIPEGAHTDEFAPKQLVPSAPSTASARRGVTNHRGVGNQESGGGGGGFWSKLFGRRQQHHQSQRKNTGNGGEVGTMMKPRKAPVKIEPKVFFANERTFLAWMHLSVTLAGASIAILAFAEDQNPFSQLYGVLLLPVAIAFIIYSMYQYSRRAVMIRNCSPGPYEDTTGPAVLGILLMITIIAQFALKLYSISYE